MNIIDCMVRQAYANENAVHCCSTEHSVLSHKGGSDDAGAGASMGPNPTSHLPRADAPQGSAHNVFDPNWMYFVHGTTTALWSGTAGIQSDLGVVDFGLGFYAFEDTPWGRRSAWNWATVKTNQGGSPLIIRVRMLKADFNALVRMDVTAQTLDSIYRAYYPDKLTGAQVVVGPVGYNDANGTRVANRNFPLQCKFEGSAVANLEVEETITSAP